MRLRIGSGFGIPIYLHWTFFLLPLWFASNHQEESPFGLGAMMTAVALLFVGVVLHELGHALMARHFGIPTQDVTLYPIGGVARLMRMSEKPAEEILIALAGPAVNVVLAIPLMAIVITLGLIDLSGNLLLHTFGGQVALLVCILNAIMVPFNLLPAFPMDGGRVLRGLLAIWLGFYPATRVAAGIGFGMAILMALAGPLVLGNYMMPVLAVFVIFAGQQELLAARMREEQRRRSDDEEALEVIPVRPRQPVATASALPALMFQPRISVYTWDNQTGTWRNEPSLPA